MFFDKRETNSEKETGRLEAFSDGVFAVAITLLVFNLKVPSPSADTLSPGGLARELFSSAQWSAYFTFFIINVAYNLLWWAAAYHRRLLFPNVSQALIKMRTRNYLLGFPSYLCAMVVGFWLPTVSIGICSVLWLFWAFTSYEKAPIQKPLEIYNKGVEQ